MRHAAVVYNPHRTSPDGLRSAFDASEARHGWATTRWYPTRERDSGVSAAQEALDGGAAVVAVAGGDGTLRAVAEVLRGSRTPLALVPSGTGNLLARNLSIPLNDIDGCVEAAFSGPFRAIDVGVIDLDDGAGDRRTHAFMVMAGIGLDAEMAEYTSAFAKKHLGWLAYVGPIARSILRHRSFRLDYRIDEESVRSTGAHTIIVGNCGTLTGNMLLIPEATIDDGKLDVVMMRPRRRFSWAQIGTRLTLQGIARTSAFSRRMLHRAPQLHTLAYAQAERFEARFETPHMIELDGDSFGLVLRARIRVQSGALLISSGVSGRQATLATSEPQAG